jgi:hypothetical protein
MNEFEDIEQLLKPQCEFKASDTLKQEVIEKARQEIKPRRIVKMWPWLAAACVAGFMLLLFAPPETTQNDEALQAQQAKKRYKMERQMAYVRTSCEQISFESLEREMRSKGEQLMAEYRNQLNTLETE